MMKKRQIILLYTNDVFLGYIGVVGNDLFVTDNVGRAYNKDNVFYLYDIIKSDIQFILQHAGSSIKNMRGYKTFIEYVDKYGIDTINVKLFTYKEIRKLKLQSIFHNEL
jgi:uncharacterized lipoprotein YehR (DUF1307 family)